MTCWCVRPTRRRQEAARPVLGAGDAHVGRGERGRAPFRLWRLLRRRASYDRDTEGPDPSAGAPLICLVSSFGGKSYTFNVPYGVGKAAIDRLALDMGYQLKAHGVATTALYPGLVQTEANREMVRLGTWDEASGGLDLSGGETPVAQRPRGGGADRSAGGGSPGALGIVEVVAELAKEFGFAEDDGSVPPSIRSLRYLLPNFVFPAIEKDAGQPVPAWVRDNVPDVLLPWSVFSSGPPPEMDNR